MSSRYSRNNASPIAKSVDRKNAASTVVNRRGETATSFGIAISVPQLLKKFEGFTGGTTGKYGEGLTSSPPYGLDTSANHWLYYLPAGISLVRDRIYGPDEQCYLEFIQTGWTDALEERLLLPRHALHAARLSVASEETWESPLAPDLKNWLEAVDPIRPSSP